ncbi:hypothetical protein [Chitinophaga sp. Cy-1792]|uniref:hypothetical protein n=1 Tax=Chitinophaga sp. Cy-1792 TaxID=2608339 RepID=UPI001424912C|nr:hypothetical protein [Chitinophaga sp. Cy-1792]NIG56947.1 hypothetical protein [Chitinophaga sp. Cy-1792]
MKQQISLNGNVSGLQLQKEIIAKADASAISNLSGKRSSESGRTTNITGTTGYTWTDIPSKTTI